MTSCDDAVDPARMDWQTFVKTFQEQTFATDLDPRRHEQAVKAVEYPPGEMTETKTDKFLADFMRYQKAFDNDEAKYAHLGNTEGAEAARDATAAQALYDKCPEPLQDVMNTFSHNELKKGKRGDYGMVINDIKKAKRNAFLKLFKAQATECESTAVGAAAVPKNDVRAAAVNAKPAERTPMRLGAESDYVVVMKVNHENATKFEEMMSSRAAMTGFLWRRLPTRYSDSVMFIVVHPVKFELESFSTSDDCRTCGATPNRLGVRPNVETSKEERDALIREMDKSSRLRKHGAEAATREPATATHREEALLLLMQELRDTLKQSSLVAPTQHLANSVVASSIGPNDSASMIGSQNSQNNTVLAQAVNTQDAHHDRTHNAGRQPMFQQPNTGAARHFGTVALLPLHGDAW